MSSHSNPDDPNRDPNPDGRLAERRFLEKRRSGYRLIQSVDKNWPVNTVNWNAPDNQRSTEPPPAPLRPGAKRTIARWRPSPSMWLEGFALVLVAGSITALVALMIRTMLR